MGINLVVSFIYKNIIKPKIITNIGLKKLESVTFTYIDSRDVKIIGYINVFFWHE
jgi:hypothetical protein